MKQKEQLEAAIRKAKIEWRRIVDSPKSTPSERSRALAEWKKASADLELALALLRRTAAERRRAILDRRKASVDSGWAKEHGNRRNMKRRS